MRPHIVIMQHNSWGFPHNTEFPTTRTMSTRSTHHGIGMLNDNQFDVELSTSPREFINSTRKIHHNKTRVVVQRIIVCKFRVSQKNKSPEGFTFVPVFVSDSFDLLDPANCDTVGKLVPNPRLEGEFIAEFDSKFIWKYENGQERVRAKEVVLQPGSDLLDLLDLPQNQCSGGGVTAKRMAKTPRNVKQIPPPSIGDQAAVPRDNDEDSDCSSGYESVESDVIDFESDSPADAPETGGSQDQGGDTDLDDDGEDPGDQDPQGQELPPPCKKLKPDS